MAGAGSSKKGMSGWVWFFLVLAVWVAAAVIVEDRKGRVQPASGMSSSTGTVRGLAPGDLVRLASADGQDIMVAVDQAALKELMDAKANGDDMGILQILVARRALPVPQDTLVRIVEAGTNGFKVQILEGDGKDYSGWVPREGVKSL